MEYIVKYHSVNEYKNYVKEGILEYLILPENNNNQIVSDWKIKNSAKLETFYYQNIFGFRICRIRLPHYCSTFLLDMEVKVKKNKLGIVSGVILSNEECFQILNEPSFFIENHLFIQKSKFANLSVAQIETFPAYSPSQHLYYYLRDLNTAVYNFFTYTSGLTNVHTDASEVFELKKGVCQDYSHVFISVARHYGIPTRYVSGYLHQGMGYVGAAQMHAWVECLIPGAGWIGFDPTNHLQSDEHYIKAAHGCDYADCAPLKGVVRTNGSQITNHSVVVQAQL